MAEKGSSAWGVGFARPLVGAIIGVLMVLFGPMVDNGAPSCDGQTMSPGDVCLSSRGGETYEEAVEGQERAARWLPRIGWGCVAAAALAYLARVAIAARRGDVEVIGSVGSGRDSLEVAVGGTGLLGGMPGKNLRDRNNARGLRWAYQGGSLSTMRPRGRRSKRLPVTLYLAPDRALEVLRRRAAHHEARVGHGGRVRNEKWFRREAAKGNLPAIRGYVRELVQNGRIDEAKPLYERLAAAGEADAAFNLGVIHHSEGRATDAERWFRTAAQAGHAKAAAVLRALLQQSGRTEEDTK